MHNFLQLTNHTINLDLLTHIEWVPSDTEPTTYRASLTFDHENTRWIEDLHDIDLLAQRVGFPPAQADKKGIVATTQRYA